MLPLTTFSPFPQLPFDLRIYIWRMAIPRERIVVIEEEIKYPDSDDDDDLETDGQNQDEDKDLRAIQILDKALKDSEYFSNNGQTQLEEFDFTSSRPKPQLPTNAQLRHARNLSWETTRIGNFYSWNPIPVLLHVCRESRQFLQSVGYTLAFSTRTAPAQTWFNFSEDFLYLRAKYEEEESSQILDGGGYWNIGQFSCQDLERVQKLALSFGHIDSYQYGASVPNTLHKAVQLFGNLRELLLVEDDHQEWERENIYWFSSPQDGEVAAVDVSVEGLFGHHPGWVQGSRHPTEWGPYLRKFDDAYSRSALDPFANMARDVEMQLRTHNALLKTKDGSCRAWETPKIRFVTLLAQHRVNGYIHDRKVFGQFIEKMYKQKLEESRKCYRAPSPLSLEFADETEAYEDYVHSVYDYSDYPPSLPVEWYSRAREMIYEVNGQPDSPYTQEWMDASDAMLDMDSWPWAE